MSNKVQTKNFSLSTTNSLFFDELKQIIWNAKNSAFRAINFAQVEANWLLGKRIVEQEQHGEAKAEYGKQIIRLASEELTKEFGKGFSETNLRSFRLFYLSEATQQMWSVRTLDRNIRGTVIVVEKK